MSIESRDNAAYRCFQSLPFSNVKITFNFLIKKINNRISLGEKWSYMEENSKRLVLEGLIKDKNNNK